MRTHLALSLCTLALAACSSEPADVQESADDFAGRIGGNAQAGDVQGTEAPNVVGATIAEAADVTQLQQLGDVGGVEFGPRSGGCTFMEGNREILMAAAMAEPTLSGKAVIRVGGELAMLDGQPGGLAAIRRGTTFSGDGVAVQIAPADGEDASRPANLAVTSADGETVTYSGNWNCA